MRYILQNLNYAAHYRGTLLAHIFALETELSKLCVGVIYLFPEAARELDWVKSMQSEGRIVYFKDEDVLKTLEDIMSEHEYNIIHTHFWNTRDSKAIKRLKRKYDIKHIIHHHNHFIQYRKTNVIIDSLKEIRKKQLKHKIRCDCNIACGIDVEKDLKEQRFSNVVCVRNAIDINRFDKIAQTNRKKFQILDTSKIFLMFGYPFYRKGVDIAIDAMKYIVKENNYVLCIVFAAKKNMEIDKIRQKCGKIPEWIRILPPAEDIGSYYRMADCFLSPSREEGCCYSIVEAGYCGLPVIYSDIESQQHIKDIPGFYEFRSEDYISLRDRIISVPEKSSLRERKDIIAKEFSMSKWCEGIISCYEKLGLQKGVM